MGIDTVLKQQIYGYENEEVCIKNICIILIEYVSQQYYKSDKIFHLLLYGKTYRQIV